MQETGVGSLGWEDPLEKGRLPTPVFWPREFNGSVGSQRIEHDWATFTFTFHRDRKLLGIGDWKRMGWKWKRRGSLFIFFKITVASIQCIYFWLCRVFASRRLSLVAASRGCSLVVGHGFSLQWLLLRCTKPRVHGLRQLRHLGSRMWAQWLWCLSLAAPMACGIFSDQGLNLCPLHRQVILY